MTIVRKRYGGITASMPPAPTLSRMTRDKIKLQKKTQKPDEITVARKPPPWEADTGTATKTTLVQDKR